MDQVTVAPAAQVVEALLDSTDPLPGCGSTAVLGAIYLGGIATALLLSSIGLMTLAGWM